ncbi:tetratricopeptide repeat protein [Myxococcota bacterium]|nr:tetratricopeptide repeat protein [Myxococcota bacterium]MBU1412959.1 tetratricopeptide repeat protein [Myxococcota bacterium]MBU1511322.1 tetratricopeptide repeat protein [Myxococcota bacterium]
MKTRTSLSGNGGRCAAFITFLFSLVILTGACSAPKKKPLYPRYLTPQSRLVAARKIYEKSQSRKVPRSRRADWQLTSARLYLDSNQVQLALPILARLAADPKVPERTRARALWLTLRHNQEGDSERYWELVRKFPETVAAEDALWKVVELSRARPGELVRRLLAFYGKHRTSFIATLVLMEAAKVAHGIDSPEWKRYAVHLLSFLARRHPDSPRWDEALYKAAGWSRELGKTKEAIAFLHQLMKTRESSLFFGDYNSQWLDDSQLLLGDLYLERNMPKAALKAWSDLPAKFPESRLRDRAWIRLMEHHASHGRPRLACSAARELVRKMPRSRFAPQAKKLLAGCTPKP